MKICGKCKEEKTAAEFSKSKSSKDGLQGYCKECMRDRYRELNPKKEKKPKSIKEKKVRGRKIELICKRCGSERIRLTDNKTKCPVCTYAPDKTKPCANCSKPIKVYNNSTLCVECFVISVKKESVVCPLCGVDKPREEYKLRGGKKAQGKDSRKFYLGCADCRTARRSEKKLTRICTNCGVERTLEHFTSTGKYCSVCTIAEFEAKQKVMQERQTQIEKNRLERESVILKRIGNRKKICGKCGNERPFEDFHKSRNSVDGRQAYCKSCMVSARADWALRNPERDKELETKYKQSARYKVTKKNSKYRRRQRLAKTPKELELTAEQERLILEFYGRRCLCCGSTEDVTLDHVKPLALGGLNSATNIQILCRECNSRKGAKEIDYRREKLSFV